MPLRPPARLLLAALAAAPAAPAVLAAQEPTPGAPAAAAPVVERPAAFDSAGRVLVVTPALAARLRLAAPAFPVTGPFVEARLFAAPEAQRAGPAVLSVSRPGGAVERYPLGADARVALRAAVDAGVLASGGALRGDSAVIVSEPASRPFVRNQTLLGLFLYGPTLAGLVADDDGATATLAYAAGAGAAFITSLAVSRQQPVTRAQATLSGSGALGGAAAGVGLMYFVADPDEGRAYAGAALAGALGGTIAGFRLARGMTDAEASASTTGAFLGAATALGAAGALGSYQSSSDAVGRATVGSALAALGAGYVLGPRYARVRRYTVTAGDVSTLSTAALIGATFGAAVGFGAGSETEQPTLAGATAGLVGGALLGDRLLVRRFDHTASEAGLVELGTGVGALLGSAIVGSANVEGAPGIALVGLGGLAGFAAAEAILAPAPDSRLGRLRTSLGVAPARRLAASGRVRVSPAGLALARLTAARGGRGTFPLLSMTF